MLFQACRRLNVAAFGERPGAKLTNFCLTFLSGKHWLNFFVEYIVRVNNFYMPFKIFALMGDHTLKIIFFLFAFCFELKCRSQTFFLIEPVPV